MSLSPFPALAAGAAILWTLCIPSIAQEEFEGKPREEARRGEKKKEGAPREPGDRAAENQKLANAKREIGELRQAGRHEEADRLQQQVAAALERREGEKREKRFADGPDRIQHIHEAIKHLHAAGLPEQARHLEQATEKMRAQFERRDRGTDHELREQLEQLRAQMQKMAHAMEELRAQVQKHRESEPRKE